MPDMFEDAAAWMGNAISEFASADIVYERISGESLSLKAAPGRTTFTVADLSGMLTDIVSHDFIVMAAAFPFDPGRGDTIMYKGSTYEVMAPNGQPHWRWCDRQHVMKRIHTKEIS